MSKIVKEHVTKKTLIEYVVVPEHDERKETKEFRQAKKQLKKDGNYKCWICGCTENLNVHHFVCEYSLQTHVDYNKLKETCEIFDIYGYGKAMKDIPMTSVDDIRNTMVLCREHHMDQKDEISDENPTGVDTIKNGIHDISFPIWISQKNYKDGLDPVPDNDYQLEQIQEKINNKHKE
jgi:hypothetical protein